MMKKGFERIAKTRREFAKFMYLLEYIAQQHGFQYGIATTQAALETGYGFSVLGRNLFGIKCTRSWLKKGGRCKNAKTFEEISGRMRPVPGCFRIYDSYEDSLMDYISLIHRLKRYRRAWANRNNYKIYFEELEAAGYATDSGYAEKCIARYEQLFLRK